jgi:2-octaprenyl-6-methoxyphenol hydroxylase
VSVIIVGGGMTGVTLAIALSQLTQGKLDIDLVEAHRSDDGEHPGFDSRSIALAQGTCQKLDQIGVWPLLKDRAEAIKTIHVSDRGHFGQVCLNAADFQLPAFGHVIELHDAGAKLFRLLNRHDNIRFHCPARMVAMHRREDGVEVTLDNGQILTAPLAVAADGSHSPLAAAAGMTWQTVDYRQFAVIANVTLSQPQVGMAFERFTESGPLAVLPAPQNRYSLVWCHNIDCVDEVQRWSNETFIYRLQKAFGGRLGAIDTVGRRQSYPLSLRYAHRQISHRLALVGNASQTLHPIAGQGFNLAMRDVIGLAETLSDALKQGQDIGCYSVLRRYQKVRESDRQLSIGLTGGLVGLFSNQSLPLVGVRNAAMLTINNSHFLQRLLVRQTLGQFRC